MSDKSIFLDKLKDHISRYSPGQRKIAEYVLGNLHSAAFKTGKELATASGVSEATISRFVGRLGYPNYSAYQKDLQLQVMAEFKGDKRFKKAIPGRDHAETPLTKFVQQELDNIAALQRNFDQDAFGRAVDAIFESRTTTVIGVRGCAALAQRLSFGLYKIQFNVSKISKLSAESFEKINRLTPEDTIVVIAFPRYLASMVKLIEYARSKHVRIVAITDSEFSLIQGDINLYCAARNTTFISNHCAPLILINSLIHEISLQESDRTLQALETFENLAEITGFFCPPGLEARSRRGKYRTVVQFTIQMTLSSSRRIE